MRGLGLRLRSVTLYLPQPVAAALKYPPLSTLPTLGAAHFPESADAHPSFLLARWRHETTITASTSFQQWYMNLAAPGPHLAAVLSGSNFHYEVVQLCQIPLLRLTLTTRVPCAGAPPGTPQPTAAPSVAHLARALTELGWTADTVAQMPREVHHPSPSELLLSLRDDEPRPPRGRSPFFTTTQVASTFSYHFLEPRVGSTPRLAAYFSFPRGYSLVPGILRNLHTFSRLKNPLHTTSLASCSEQQYLIALLANHGVKPRGYLAWFSTGLSCAPWRPGSCSLYQR